MKMTVASRSQADFAGEPKKLKWLLDALRRQRR
jgi:hypothetical protein